MKNLKKVLALVLAFACAFTMFAGAASFTDEADIQAKDAVNMLTALGVIEGYEDGSFDPDGVVTRAEMAKMIFVVRNNSIDDSAYANTASNLTDIDSHWAKGYIKFCESQGIIAGKGNGIFDPDATVTGTEAAKMLLVLAGYEPSKAGLEGTNWATNTLRYAGAAGILDDVSSGLESGLPRQYAAQMIYNTLDTDRVKWSTDSESFDNILNGGVKETVGAAYMGLTKTVATLVSVQKDSLTLANPVAAESDGGLNAAVNFTKVSTDYSDLLGQQVKVLYKDGKTNQVLGVTAMADNTTITVAAGKVSKNDAKIKVDGTSYALENDINDNAEVNVYVNDAANGPQNAGPQDSDYFDGRNLAQDASMMTFVDSDGNGKLDAVIVEEYIVAKTSYVGSDSVIVGNTSYDFADENIDENLAKDDWAVVSYNRYDDCRDITKVETISGTVTNVKTDENADDGEFYQYMIDGTWYNSAVLTDSTAVNYANTDINTVRAGDSVNAVIYNGVVFMIKRTSDDNSVVTDAALVVSKDDDTLQGKQMKLRFFNGDEEVVDFDTDSAHKAWDEVTPGHVYSYDISDGNYMMGDLTNEADYYNGFTWQDGAAVEWDGTNTTIGGVKIADTAKILLWSGNASKVITGKQFVSSLGDSIPADGTTALLASFRAEMGGLNRVGAAAFSVTTLPTDLVTKDNYAYIVDDASWSRVNSEVTYTIWTGTEYITVKEDHTRLNDRVKGSVIGYSSLDEIDGSDAKKINDVKYMDMEEDAVETVSTKQDAFTTYGGEDFDIDNDTVVLYVDSSADSDKVGLESCDIQKAYENTNGDMVSNILYYATGTSLELLVVDARNEMSDSPYVASIYQEADVMRAIPALGTIVTATDLENATGVSVANTTVDRGDVLTLSGTVDNAARKVKITLTGAIFDNDTNEKTVTAAAIDEDITVDGSSDEVTVTFEALNAEVKLPNDMAANLSGALNGNYDSASYVDGEKQTGGDTVFVDLGKAVEIRFVPKGGLTAGQTDTIDLMNGIEQLDTVSFVAGDGMKTMNYTVEKDVMLTLAGTKAAAVTPIFVETSAKGYDQFGDEVTNAADVGNVKTIKVQFNVAMDKITVETVANWTDTTLDITKVVYDEATKTATFTVTGAANNATIAAKAAVKAADGVAMANTSVITLHNADTMITVANN